jgi:hypothetical protein
MDAKTWRRSHGERRIILPTHFRAKRSMADNR